MCGSQSHIAPLPLSEDSQTALRLTSDKSEEHPSHSSSSSHSGDRINFVAARLLVANKGATKSSSGRFSMTLIPESVGTHSPLGQGINTPVTRRNVMGLSSSGLSPSMKSVVVSTDNAETPNEDEDAIESNSLLSPPTSSVGVDSRTENGRLGRSLLVRHVFGTIWDITGAVTERFVSYLIPPLHPVSCNATLVNYLRPSDQHVVQEVEITRNIERGVVASDGIGMQGEDSSATLDPLTLPVPLWRASIILFVCISYVAGSAYLIVLVASAFVKLAQLDSSTVGATLVALGSEIPDVISSITLAKHGYIDAAFASAIGSQVINVSVVVGFSSLLACFLNRSAGSEGTSIGLDISKSEIPRFVFINT